MQCGANTGCLGLKRASGRDHRASKLLVIGNKLSWMFSGVPVSPNPRTPRTCSPQHQYGVYGLYAVPFELQSSFYRWPSLCLCWSFDCSPGWLGCLVVPPLSCKTQEALVGELTTSGAGTTVTYDGAKLTLIMAFGMAISQLLLPTLIGSW